MSEDLWIDIIAEMHQRRAIGLAQYKVPVTSDPKVNWRKHLEEELLDAVVYNRAAGEMEQKYKELQLAVARLLDVSYEACKHIDYYHDNKVELDPNGLSKRWVELHKLIDKSVWDEMVIMERDKP